MTASGATRSGAAVTVTNPDFVVAFGSAERARQQARSRMPQAPTRKPNRSVALDDRHRSRGSFLHSYQLRYKAAGL